MLILDIGTHSSMNIELSERLRIDYPKAVFGSLMVRGVKNMKQCEKLEKRKRELENWIRKAYDATGNSIIEGYRAHFKRWKKTYPIEFQIKTIRKGGAFPKVSVLVDSMFMAELKNRILTSGHDLDEIRGDLIFDVSRGGERYVKLNGEEQEAKAGDVLLRDREGLLATVLFGPARRTSITPETRNVLYLAWCPYGIGEELIRGHLEDIRSNLELAYETLEVGIGIYV
jgi:DNA/RNA-binding domain of Phe-tRNA-synthetase-like protein